MGAGNTGELLRSKGVPEHFGYPVDAAAWFDNDGAARIIVADYANGRRVEFRHNARTSRLSYTTPTNKDTTDGAGV